MSGYIGNIPVPQATQTRQSFTATASQTTFNTAGYTAGFIDVFLNGIKLVDGTDYTATNGSDVVLTTGAALDDVLDVVAYTAFDVANNTLTDATINNTLTLKNATEEDTDGGRESKITFKGEQSGGEITTLAQIQASHDGTADDEKGDLIFSTNDGSDGNTPTERLRIDSAGNVGIGVSNPSTWSLGKALHIGVKENNLWGEGDYSFSINQNAYYNAGWKYTHSDVATSYGQESGTHRWKYAASGTADAALTWSEAMRIDSSGNLLVGTTDTNLSNNTGTDTGFGVISGELQVARDGGVAMFNRTSTDGDIVVFRKDGTTVGSIGSRTGNNIYVNSQANSGRLSCGGSEIYGWNLSQFWPVDDNLRDLGVNTDRWDDVYATNGTIQTSDQNEKQQIASLTDAEITAAKAISKLFKTFKWNDAVTKKGDAARTHTGVIAQDVEQAMTDAGLNAGDYAFFISTTWWETYTDVPAVEAVDAVYETVTIPAVLDDDGNEVEPETTEQRLLSEAVEGKEAYTRTDKYHTLEEAPEGATERNRKGIRYPQLLSFIGAATEQRLASIESRLDALENPA